MWHPLARLASPGPVGILRPVSIGPYRHARSSPTLRAPATSSTIKLKEGSCLVSDGRLWRADGEGTVLEFAFIGPQMRMEENNVLAVLATTSEVLEAMPPEAKAQLGFNVWYSYGNAGIATRAMVTSGDPRTPMDGPSQSVTGGTARR